MIWNPHCFVLNDPGTGKTISTLWAADFLMSTKERYKIKALVLAPLSTLKEVWFNEICRHLFPNRSAAIVHGNTKKRLKKLSEEVDFYIINYDGIKIPQVAIEIEKRTDIKIVVIDESTAYSEGNTDRHAQATRLLRKRPFMWMLTGTPVIRSHLAAHGQAKLMHPGYTESRSKFKERTMVNRGLHKWEPQPWAYDEARKLLKPAIRVPRRAMHDLPPSIPMQYEAPFSEAQHKLYNELKKQYRAATSGGATISAVHEGALRLKLLQIAAGAVYDSKGVGHVIDCKPRLELLSGLIRESPDKLLVFASFTCVLEMLFSHFRKLIPSAFVNGSISLKARSQIFHDFQNGDHLRVIFADPGTMSHGLTLTAATTAVWWTPTDKAEVYTQANYRIDRPGKIKDTYTAQISGCPVEREIFSRLEKLQSLEGAMMKLIEKEGLE
jgi:SNF2 family DNA or RNA helicase